MTLSPDTLSPNTLSPKSLASEPVLVLRADNAKTIEIATFPSAFADAAPAEEPDLNTWRTELEELRRQAHDDAAERGYREGFESGRVGAQEATSNELQNAAEQLLREWRELRIAHDQAVGPLLAEAAIEIAALILAAEVRDIDAATRRAVSTAATALPPSGPLQIRLHPDAVGLPFLNEHFGPDAEVTPDPTVARGDCVMTRGLATSEVRVDEMLEAMRVALRGVVDSTESGVVDG